MLAEFGPWLPDLPDYKRPGLVDANNVIPTAGGYRPLRQPQTYSQALDSRCLGAVFVKDASGNAIGFAGDASKLYRLSGAGGEWSDVSRAVGYSVPVTSGWSFTVFGDRVIAANGVDPIQSFQLGVSTIFENLDTDAPIGSYVAAIHPGFLLVANLDGSSTQVRWSAIQDPTNWPEIGSDEALSLQSDFQQLYGDGGNIQGIAAGLTGADWVIIQERALWRVSYVGSPVVFQFDEVEGSRGTAAPFSIVQVGGAVYYFGEDGFYRYDGQVATPIGASQVDRTILDDIDINKQYLVSAAVDPVNKLVFWAYANDSAGDIANRVLVYNWELGQWARGDVQVEAFTRALTFGQNLDDITDDIDSGIPSLDSSIWKGGAPVFGCFTSSHKLAYFVGRALEATFDTQATDINGRPVRVSRIRPLVQGSTKEDELPTYQAAVGSQYRLDQAPTFGPYRTLLPTGQMFTRQRGMYHRIRLKIPAGQLWEFAQGLEVL